MLFAPPGTLTRRRLPPGKHAEAEPLYRRAVDIRERVQGEHHPSTAATLNDLAGLLQAQGARLHAMQNVSATLGLQSNAELLLQVSVQKPLSFGMLYGAGTLTRRCLPPGKCAEAEPLYRQGLDVDERVLGEHHSL
jgi:hypothetical protein